MVRCSLRAEKIYQEMSPNEQEACRRILLRLVQPGEGSEDTKRRARWSELVPDDQKEVSESVIDSLVGESSRLLTVDRISNEDSVVVEVAHEALIRCWTRMRSWIEPNREGLKIHNELSKAATAWQQSDRDPSYLYRQARLTETEEWMEKNDETLFGVEKEFFDASISARDDAEAPGS